MAYVPDPTDPTRPVDTDTAETAALEFRNLKAYIATLAGLGGGMNLFRRNAIIGGDFSTNPWQRGVTFAAIANSAYNADRWVYQKATTGAVHTLTKTANAPTVAQAGLLTNHCLQLDCTTADAAVAAGDTVSFQQFIEGYNFAEMLAQRTISVSFWHAHTKTGVHCISVGNVVDRCYIAEYTQLVADAWEYSTIQVPASPSAGTWNYTTGLGLNLRFALMGGSTYQTPAGVWTVGNFYNTANQVNNCDTIGNKFRIALVQVEASGASTPFEMLPVQSVADLCQRYCVRNTCTNGNGSVVPIGGLNSAGTGANWFLPVRMRATPTITYSAGLFIGDMNGGLTAVTSATGHAATQNGVSFTTGNGAISAARPAYLIGTVGTDYIQFDAEL